MPSRRSFLGGLAAVASLPGATWADAGAPTHVSAAKDQNGSYALYGLRDDGAVAFRVALPARGHAAAVHPTAPEAVAIARRPGTYALVLDCARGHVLQRLVAPAGRHFYGHGAFSADGTRLFLTENDFESGAGRIGVWDRRDDYRRVGDFSSGGIGPHELLRLPGTGHLAVANGGIRTHPATGRAKLNLDTMRPNLTVLTEDGAPVSTADVPATLHQNSLRHLAARPDGLIACAFQWQGDLYDSPSLLAFCRPGGALAFVEYPYDTARALAGYSGSVAFSSDGAHVAITSPKGGALLVFGIETGERRVYRKADVCGVASAASGLVSTDGEGRIHHVASDARQIARHEVAFDNHLVRIAP